MITKVMLFSLVINEKKKKISLVVRRKPEKSAVASSGTHLFTLLICPSGGKEDEWPNMLSPSIFSPKTLGICDRLSSFVLANTDPTGIGS